MKHFQVEFYVITMLMSTLGIFEHFYSINLKALYAIPFVKVSYNQSPINNVQNATDKYIPPDASIIFCFSLFAIVNKQNNRSIYIYFYFPRIKIFKF